MRTFRFFALCSILCGLMLASVGMVAAQESAPLRTIDMRAGPYPLRISYYNEPKGGTPLVFSITPETEIAGELRYQVTAMPGTMVNAVAVKANLSADPEHPNGVRGTVNLPVSGQWSLSISVEGPLGHGSEFAPVLAAARTAIPVWLGWVIGLLPVWAIIGFVLWRARPAPKPALVRA